MFIYKRVSHLRDEVTQHKSKGLKVAFIPTMGALHDGHLSLVKLGQQAGATTLASIFVNPKQFNDPEDLKKYPRQVDKDLRLLQSVETDIVFIPGVEDVYPPGDNSTVQFDPGLAASTMEGKFRPGHFAGMAEVVYRLLKITTPDLLFMGQKDFQQYFIIRKMIHHLELPVQLIMGPTVREQNGLAMSSRNERLSPEARQKAGVIYGALQLGKEKFFSHQPIEVIQQQSIEMFLQAGFEPEYFEIVDGHTLNLVNKMTDASQIVACCAVKVEGIRLIDNMIWKDM